MKTRFTLLGILAILIISICVIFVSCNKELNDIVKYYGEVVYINTTNPFPNLTVKVTNGTDTHCQTLTDETGGFELKVRVNEIDGNYYLLVSDSTCVPKKVALGGYGQAEVDLGVIEVEGPKPPIVVTLPVSSRKAGTVITGGNVTDGGCASVTARGVCWSKSEYPTISDDHTSNGKGEGEFESNITGLSLETTYYFRAYATNRMGTSYGEQVMFTTGHGKTDITTDSVFAVYATSAKCAGTIVNDGNFAVLSCGICWAMTPDPTVQDNVSFASVKSGHFECSMRNLEVSTTYFVCAFAENENGYAYGQCLPVTTKSGKPIISIGEPTVKAKSIAISGTIEDNGGFAITERGICYSSNNTEPTIVGNKVECESGDGSFDVNIQGLEPSTTYYLRAYATNSKGTSYSKSCSATTLSGSASISLNVDKSTITVSSVSSTITITSDGGGIIQSCGVCWSEDPNPTLQGNKVEAAGKKLKTPYTCNIYGLEPNTTYYIRAYATTEVTTEYSNSTTIQTSSGKLNVTTLQTYESGVDYLVISGSTTNNEAPVTRQGVCWSTISNPSINDNVVDANSVSANPFSCLIEGLQSGTTYYCRAFAENMYGLEYGATLTCSTNYGPTTLTGYVYDQDGNPISGATVMGYDVSGYSGTTDNNGYYSITLGKRMFGKYEFRAYADNYNDDIKEVTISRGQETQQDFTLAISNAFSVDLGTGIFVPQGRYWQMLFNCSQSSLAGHTTTKNMRIKNHRSVAVSYSITNLPNVGILFSSNNGTIPAKGEISITVTFTYPTTSAQMINLTGCGIGIKTYIWNWEGVLGGFYADQNGTPNENACCALCYQTPIITVDGNSEGFDLIFNQYATY